jgi:hypothetical protein
MTVFAKLWKYPCPTGSLDSITPGGLSGVDGESEIKQRDY